MKPGNNYKDGQGKYLRVMAYSNGYYMIRYGSLTPFVKSKKELIEIILIGGYFL